MEEHKVGHVTKDTRKPVDPDGRECIYMLVRHRQECDVPWGLINIDTATKEDINMFAEWVKDVLLRRLME